MAYEINSSKQNKTKSIKHPGQFASINVRTAIADYRLMAMNIVFTSSWEKEACIPFPVAFEIVS